jgi:predicted transcriptional regulator
MSTEALKEVVQRAKSWPPEDQDELAEYARVIQARRDGHYILSTAERAAVAEGKAQADRGQFVPDERLAEADRRRYV